MTVPSSNQARDRKSTPPVPIQITGISLSQYPADGYEYRGVIRSQDESGNLLAEPILAARTKPAWLVSLAHPGMGRLEVILQSRPGMVLSHQAQADDNLPWQDMGRVTLDPHTYLDWTGSTVVDLPLRNWDESILGRVLVRLSKKAVDARPEHQHLMPPGPMNTAVPAPLTCPFGFGSTPAPATRTVVTGADIPADDALTAPEAVLVRDGWNKFLAYQDMLIGLFFERLLHEAPELTDCFGDAIDLIPRYFADLFDGSIRALNPQTEPTLRDGHTYAAPPGAYKTTADYATLLTDLGMRTDHWLAARRVWVWAMTQIPHLDEYDRENLSKGIHSAAYRFFTFHILPPAVAAINQYADSLTPTLIADMRRCCDLIAADSLVVSHDFYRILRAQSPEVMPALGHTDPEGLAEHLVQTIRFLVTALEAGQDATQATRELSRLHTHVGVPPEAYAALAEPLLAVMRQYMPTFTPDLERAWRLVLNRAGTVLQQPAIARQRVLTQARDFIDQLAHELNWSPADHTHRWREIEQDIQTTGTYTQTTDELTYGAQLAWRNAGKCIGRVAWRSLLVRDLRHVTDPDFMFREVAEHLRVGTSGGSMQSVINIFRPKHPGERWGPRIWNSQYIRFAAYEQADGTVLGDGANRALTRALLRIGWTPPATKTAFDPLPLVIEVPGQGPKIYEFAREDILTVSIEHPGFPEVSALNLRWCAIPAIANFSMEIGGIHYSCAPFNGWFMETEIARNLWEDGRYGQAEAIALAMGLDTASEQLLWRDRAFLELNVAVLHSFAKARVTLVDHQTASRQFLSHDLREKRAGRECPAQWSWVVPSAGGSTTPVWHHEMRDFYLSPAFHHAADKWATIDAELVIAGEEGVADVSAPNRVVILYGSETGTAERYAYQAARRLDRHHPRVMALDDYNPAQLEQEHLVLVITSTFADGDLPGNAKRFHAWIREQPARSLNGPNYALMALGSTIYPTFCAAGATLNRELNRVGGNRVIALQQADEMKGQADTVRHWLDRVAQWLGDDPAHNAAALAGDAVQLQVSFLTANQVTVAQSEAQTSHRPGVTVPVVANRELLEEVIPGSRSTRFMAFDISDTAITYETGDHVAIYPHNSPSLVQRLCARLGIDPSAWFVTSLVDQSGADVAGNHEYSEPVQVGQVLAEDFDLSLRAPVGEIIGLLRSVAQTPADQERLAFWADGLSRDDADEVGRALRTFIASEFVTVVDLLEAFPSVPVQLVDLIGVLPRQKPRLYSISSCSLVHPEQIHIIVGVVQTITGGGQTHVGLCSGYLAGLDPEQDVTVTVRLAVRTSTFRPPLDPQAPMLMVGPGTGLAPLIGFLQHREVQFQALHEAQQEPRLRPNLTTSGADAPLPTRLGDTWLYFGCRNLNDYLYRQELEAWHEAGVLTHLEVAFSRLGNEKVYVQHLIGQRSESLWDVLSQPNCHYYVCGDARMADEVFDVLMTIAQTTGGLSYADAIRFFWTMQQENRLVIDVWGNLLQFRQSLATVPDVRCLPEK